MSGISLSKEGLKAATDNFTAISTNISSKIESIRESLNTIEGNWSGPEHESAANDKKNAEENMEKAINTINSMNEAIALLSANANKISYNG